MLVALGNFESLVSYFGFTAYIFYALTTGSLIILRQREPTLCRPFSVSPYPLLPVVFIIVSAGVVVTSFVRALIPSTLAVVFVFAGVPVFFLFFDKNDMVTALKSFLRQHTCSGCLPWCR